MKKISLILFYLAILSGCSNNPLNNTNKQNLQSIEITDKNATSSSITQSSTKSSKPWTSSDQGISSINMTIVEAKKIYEKEYPESSITAIDVDSSFGTYYFKIEGVDDNKEYELKINTSNSKVFKKREELLDPDEQNGVKRKNEVIDFLTLKPLKEIIEIVEPLFEGSIATDADLEKEVGVTYWDITLENGVQEIEVKIDATDGKILEKSMDD